MRWFSQRFEPQLSPCLNGKPCVELKQLRNGLLLLLTTALLASCGVPTLHRSKALQTLEKEGRYGRVHFWGEDGAPHGIPVVMPKEAPVIISDFHSGLGARSGTRSQRHQGMDIYAKTGTPILAAADGTVLEAVVEKCWGPTILIDHRKDDSGNRLLALYGHLGRMLVDSGDPVQRGQQIAVMGPPLPKCGAGMEHLHFQLNRRARGPNKEGYWGWGFFVQDGQNSLNPHRFWANGPGRVTCFWKGEVYPQGTLTYPVRCLPLAESQLQASLTAE
jgi:murein DD-endopeptidase MepM/ murein hydrolase activator NlpD